MSSARGRGGLTEALGAALGLARAPLVARLDADDIALPERLERQRAFLGAHPDVGLLGTAAREVDAAGRELAVVRPPTDDPAIRCALIRRNPFVHSSVMMRRAAVERAGGYDPAFPVAQDYDLWMRMSRVTRMANLSSAAGRPATPAGAHHRDAGDGEAPGRSAGEVARGAGRRLSGWYALFALRPLIAQMLPAGARGGSSARFGSRVR